MEGDSNKVPLHMDLLSRLSSMYGHPFSPGDDEWALSRDVVIRIWWLRLYVSDPVNQAFRVCLSVFAQYSASMYCANLCNRFKMLVEGCNNSSEGQIQEITARHIMVYRASLREDQEHFLIILRQLFLKWNELGLSGINPDVIAYFRAAKLRQNRKGHAVATRCPEKGPLTDEERSMVYDALTYAYEDGNIDNETFAICMVFMLTGRRRSQVADLKIRDLKSIDSQDGSSIFLLNIPRRKQRGPWRAESTSLKVVADLGMVLELQIGSVKKRIEIELGHMSPEAVAEFPLFPAWKVIGC